MVTPAATTRLLPGLCCCSRRGVLVMRWKFSVIAILVLVVGFMLFAGCNQKPARTDAQVAGDVQSKIYSDAAIDSRTISVQANTGVVILSGNVSSDAERSAAANDAATVNGVKTVVNNL